MKYTWLFLIFGSYHIVLIKGTDDVEETEPDPEFAAYLREAIENFRTQMKTGIPEIKMPVLDPLHLEDMDIEVQENVAKIHLHINEMAVGGLSNFTLNNIQADLENLFIHLNVSLTRLVIMGDYSLDGRLFTILPVYGNGNYSINATTLTIGGTGQLNFTKDTIQLSVLTLDLMFEKITMDLGNFLGGGRFGEVMQEIIPGVGRDVFLLYRPLILKKLQDSMKAKINEELNKPTVKDIIKDMLPMQK